MDHTDTNSQLQYGTPVTLYSSPDVQPHPDWAGRPLPIVYTSYQQQVLDILWLDISVDLMLSQQFERSST